jgi:Spy/CpxP family protein refolding chaperone
MRSKKNFWMIGVGLLLVLALLVPAMAQEKKAPAKKETMAEFFQKERERFATECQLGPDKIKEFLALGDKYDKQRKNIIEQIKKNEAELEKAVDASSPDEAKIKSLVDEAVSNQEKLFETFKVQRREEMELLTPMQQGRYLLALMKAHKTQYERIKIEKK